MANVRQMLYTMVVGLMEEEVLDVGACYQAWILQVEVEPELVNESMAVVVVVVEAVELVEKEEVRWVPVGNEDMDSWVAAN